MVKKQDDIPEDVNDKDSKVDIQTYEPISGATILEGLSISKKIKLNDLEKVWFVNSSLMN